MNLCLVTFYRYDKLVETFYSRLLSQRRHAKQMQEKNKQWGVQKMLKKYPGWNEMTVSNLHSLFLLFDNQKTGMLSYPDLWGHIINVWCLNLNILANRFEMFWLISSAVLESIGDSTNADFRKQKFDNADVDTDGWISYDEFLALLYNFTPPIDGELTGVAKLCYDIAENVRFVSSLSVGEQLEYGLF